MNFAYLGLGPHRADTRQTDFARDLVAGLRAAPKTLPAKYFYDDEGSRLFERITALPEYYLTRTELRLLETYAADMAAGIGPDVELVEFGAGSLAKVGLLLDALESPRAYMPIDISRDYLAQHAAKLAPRYPSIAIRPVAGDFTKPLLLPHSDVQRAGFFPGSTIGNLSRVDTLIFLRRAAALFRGAGLLIGVDLVKDPALLHAAYNDAEGVTAAFNRNMLARANRELGTDFDLDAFAHYAFYEPRRQCVEMHLLSMRRQRIHIGDETLMFQEGESVHTEDSQKYTVSGFRALASEAGFRPRFVWTDPDRLFSIHWLEA
jgi:dimethylhistidine N-methyltransferase